MKRGADGTEQKSGDAPSVALCASCDRCRMRKTKCDGKRPCGNCAAKFMKKNKLTSIEGIDIALFECVYSPAKRRGPVPGRVGQARKASSEAAERNGRSNPSQAALLQQPPISNGQLEDSGLPQIMLQQGLVMGSGLGGNLADSSLIGGSNVLEAAGNGYGGNPQMMQQYLQFPGHQQQQTPSAQAFQSVSGDDRSIDMSVDQGPSRRARTTPNLGSHNQETPDTVACHLPLLSRESIDGNRLRAYFRLSVDELFTLPPVPTDEEYCARLGITPQLLPKAHQLSLRASRFAELALGAIVHNEVALAMELCNATVHCLRECIKEPVKPQYLFEVARAYFLLGTFRAFRGDMERYFKYRRVSLTHLSKLENNKGNDSLLAAMAYLDSWAYMMYNANETKLPKIDDSIPQVCPTGGAHTEMERDFGCASAAVARDPKNQMWIQGAPPVYLNNEAPLPARSLDALACAIRSCCDQANGRFALLSKEAIPEHGTGTSEDIPDHTIITPTTVAVLARENELCSRNMVLSASTLLRQFEATTGNFQRNQGHHLIISALDAFLDGGDDDGSGGFTDAQIQSLLSVCNTAVENPFLLHHGGPTYHIVSNAAILLCHLLNGMHAMNMSAGPGANREMEAAVFEEVLDTFLSVRKLLNIHRRKLPVLLRCHGIPRPNLGGPKEGKAFVDLGETLMCGCRGCQGFVLMACSPCVAAERARAATHKLEIEAAREAESVEEVGELDKALYDLETEFDLDDDVLLNMLSRIVTA